MNTNSRFTFSPRRSQTKAGHASFLVPRSSFLVFFLAFSLQPLAFLPAATRYVWGGSPAPGAPYDTWNTAARTIQEAVDAATAGDTVWVTNGVYDTGGNTTASPAISNRVVITQAITVQSVNGPAVTFIKGAPDGLTGACGTNAVRCVRMTTGRLSGFTLTNGFTRADSGWNDQQGGGGAFISGSAIVSNCVVSGCAAAHFGGGIDGMSGAEVWNCIVTNNTSYDGGGLQLEQARAYNCLVRDNRASHNGGGVYYYQQGAMFNSTVCANTATNQGGGVYHYLSGTNVNCIFYFNTAIVSSNNHCISSSGTFLYSCTTPAAAGTSNLTSDPLFVNAGAGDYHLQATSPCANKGTNQAWMSGTIELGGVPRVLFATADLGAYEYPGQYQPVAGFGKALDFDGANDYVRVADHDALDLTNNYTVEAWIYVHSFKWLAGIISKYHSSGIVGYYLRLHNTAPYSGIGFDGLQTANGLLTSNCWYHLAAINSNSTRLLYVNGGLVPMTGSPNTVVTNADPLCIGVDYLAGARYFDGLIDEVRIWKTPLSQAAVTNWMYREIDTTHPAYTNLVAYYKLNEGSGTAAADTAGGDQPGTLYNMAAAAWVDDTLNPLQVTAGQTVSGWLVGSDQDGASSDGANWTINFEIATQGAKGTATAGPANAIQYTALPGVVGLDSFTYRVRDEAGNVSGVSTGQVIITACAPLLDVTTTNTTVWGETEQYTITGTANGCVVGTILWTNAATGASGAFAAATSWTIPDVALMVGSNLVTVFGTNIVGLPASDSVVITRLTEHGGVSPAHYVSLAGSHVWPFADWATAATNLQAAVDTATTNDTVLVAAGVYAAGGALTPGHLLANRVVIAKPLTLRSVNGPAQTFIEGLGDPVGTNGLAAMRCVYLANGGQLVGFTLTNGHTYADGQGAWGFDDGGGGLWQGADTLVSNCVITTCSASCGGGAMLYLGGLLTHSQLRSNWADGDGGGLYLASEGEVRNCVIRDNESYWFTGGASLDSGGLLINCLIIGNYAENQAGGAWLYAGGRLENCTVSGNSTGNLAGGVLMDGGTNLNSILYFNTAGANIDNYYVDSGATFMFTCTTPLPGGQGNFTNDPLFVNAPAGNYHLQTNSPCIDNGANQAWMNTATDLDGQPRLQDGTVDLGAYEASPPTLKGAIHGTVYTPFNWDAKRVGAPIADVTLTYGVQTPSISSVWTLDPNLPADHSETSANLNWNTSGSFWAGGAADQFGAVFTASFTAPSNGNYTFWLKSDDGSALVVDGITRIDHDGLHDSSVTKSNTLNLAAGAHTLEVRYFEAYGGAVLKLEWQPPSQARQLCAPAGGFSGKYYLYNQFHQLGQTTTDAQGRYAFTNIALPPGRVTYLVRASKSGGYTFLSAWEGWDNAEVVFDRSFTDQTVHDSDNDDYGIDGWVRHPYTNLWVLIPEPGGSVTFTNPANPAQWQLAYDVDDGILDGVVVNPFDPAQTVLVDAAIEFHPFDWQFADFEAVDSPVRIVSLDNPFSFAENTIGELHFTLEDFGGFDDVYYEAQSDNGVVAYPRQVLFDPNTGQGVIQLQNFTETGGTAIVTFYVDDEDGYGASYEIDIPVTVNPADDPPLVGGGRVVRFFSGNDLEVTNLNGIIPGNEITVEFWAKLIALVSGYDLIRLEPSQTTNSLAIRFPWGNDSKITWKFGHTNVGLLAVEPPPGVNLVGEWHHFAFVASQSGNGMKVYLDGTQIGAKSGMSPLAAGNYALILGAVYHSSEMAEFRIWNVARSASQIADAKDIFLSGQETGLVLYYRFSEDSVMASLEGVQDAAPAGGQATGSVKRWGDSGFLHFVGNEQRGVYRETYYGINGMAVANLTNHANFPAHPDWVNISDDPIPDSWQFSGFDMPQDENDNYGQWVHGYLLPPVTGEYTFWIASDDQSMLFISTNESPTTKSMVATVPGHTGWKQWTKYPSQHSEPLWLVEGQRYYIEALMKEGPGADSLSVGWQIPGNNSIEIIPKSQLLLNNLRLRPRAVDGASVLAYFPAYDVDSSNLVYTITRQPAHGTVTNASGGTGPSTDASWRYVPDATHYNGDDSFDYAVNDGVNFVTNTFWISCSAYDAPPEWGVLPHQLIEGGQALGPLRLDLRDPDNAPDTLLVYGQSLDQSLVRDTNIVLGLIGTNWHVTITPNPGELGTVTIYLTAQDYNNTRWISFDLRVTPAPAYVVMDLGRPSQNYSATYGTAINDQGAVAGYASTSRGQAQGFLFSGLEQGSVMSAIGSLTGTNGASKAYGINILGQVTGVSPNAGGSDRAFLYDGETMTDLGALGTTSVGLAINENNEIAGYGKVGGQDRAFYYRSGNYTNLGVLPGHQTSRAFALNADGVVVGASYDPQGVGRAFLYGSALTNLGTLIGGTNSAAYGINQFNQVVGSSSMGLVPGQYGVSFDGLNDYASINNLQLSNLSFTVEFWAKRARGGLAETIVSQGSGATNCGLHIGFRADNSFAFGFTDDDAATVDAYPDTSWHHWACTYDAGLLRQTIYCDGIETASRTANTNYLGAGSLELGRAFGSNYFAGLLDEVRIWTWVRTPAQIQQKMNSPLTGRETGLLAYYRMNEGTGVTLTDTCTPAHPGLLVNGPGWTYLSGNTGQSAFFYDRGEMTALPALPGGGDAEARAINDFGQVVGWAINSNGQKRAFLFTAGRTHDLNDLLPDNAGWTLIEATALNNRGEIVCNGMDAYNNQRALLVMPGNVIGQSVVRPRDTVARMPEIALLESLPGDTPDNAFYWSYPENRLYAVRPVTASIKWYLSQNVLDTSRVETIRINRWPKLPQIHVGRAPVDIQPEVAGFAHSFIELQHTTSPDAQVDFNTKVFTSTNTGYSVLLYLKTEGAMPNALTQCPYFEVVRTVNWNDPKHLLDNQPGWVGTPVVDPVRHQDYPSRNGFVVFPNALYDAAGADRAYDRTTRAGPILPVNVKSTATPKADDLVVVWYRTNGIGVAWGYRPARYNVVWPTNAPQIVIASTLGSGPLDDTLYPEMQVYNQPNPNLPGYNPNEEHAFLAPAGTGQALFALRSDLNATLKYVSQPFALLKYREPLSGEWRLRVFQVLAENATYHFSFSGEAGKEIQAPYPLSLLPLCAESYGLSGPYWKDYHKKFYARAAGANGGTAHVVLRYFYPLQYGFFYDLDLNGTNDAPVGTAVPWLGRVANPQVDGPPVNIDYVIVWPAQAEALQVGETLLSAKHGLPDIQNMASAEILYDNSDPNKTLTNSCVRLFDPLTPRVLKIPELSSGPHALANPAAFLFPAAVKRQSVGGQEIFPDLPYDLRCRLAYDPLNHWLSFKGVLDESGVGEPLLLPNVMSARERDRIQKLDGTESETDFDKVIAALYDLTRNPNGVDLDRNGQADLALRTGFITQYVYRETNAVGAISTNRAYTRPTGANLALLATNVVLEPLLGPKALTAAIPQPNPGGPNPPPRYITIAENSDATLGLPVTLHVIQVAGGPFTGDLKLIYPDNVFDEKLTLRHSGDFGAEPENFEFEWYYKPDADSFDSADLPEINPSTGQITDARGWIKFSGPDLPPDGRGVNYITMGDGGQSSLITLSDNWFITRYRGYVISGQTNWSAWIGDPAALNPKRAMLAEGWVKRVIRNLNPFEARTTNFHTTAANTYVSMLMQAGTRFEGEVALNPSGENLNSLGLIEVYTTVLNRARNLSIDGIPPVGYDPANNALLLAASRIADLYALLGNEAGADAADPTIGFTTGMADYHSLATAIFAFQNQLDSLLEEELVLLRGRDNKTAGVQGAPVYNRLMWNFTSGDGEVAYAQTYNLSDQNHDGLINEYDARVLFPQGHGDAWGHFLTALTTYYELLRHPKFDWKPRTESVIVAGTAVPVDYLDERKFATVAAAKAKTGAEIVDLTYRLNYVDDPAGQWQGYKDSDSDRAWGVTEWARRAHQGAFFDWAMANAVLYSADPNTNHTGIQKIDRTTVLELGEIAQQAASIQAELDQADAGLNPLGLAKGVVPFDIDPAQVSAGKTHFEQIQERALKAMNNTLLVWNQANEMSEQLRRNQDNADRFTQRVADQERDYKNRLIEIFGYPYAGDIGTGKTYPNGYDGPDLYHWMYVATTEITGNNAPPSTQFTGFYTKLKGLDDFVFPDDLPLGNQAFTLESPGVLRVQYPFSAATFGFSAPTQWGQRRAPGELQLALSEMVQQEARLKKTIRNYANLLENMEDQIELLKAHYDLNDATLDIIDERNRQAAKYGAEAGACRASARALESLGFAVWGTADAVCDGLPKIVGMANDVTAPARGAIKTAAKYGGTMLKILGGACSGAADLLESLKQKEGIKAERKLLATNQSFQVQQRAREVEKLLREEAPMRIEVFNQAEVLQQSVRRFQIVLARGERLIEERVAFRQRAAAETQEARYQDMAFRIFRNDALQKYRAQFDLAARYVCLAATAYDYESNLLGDEGGSGRQFLTDLVRHRSLGQMEGGLPVAGVRGLADPLARMVQNFDVLKPQLGFNNPQTETGRFSLRNELFRIGAGGAAAWQSELIRHRVANLWDLPEFRRYCRPFADESAGPQPGLVIRFPTCILFGRNFFGWPLAGGDSAYDPTLFATKVRSVGVWFSDYNGAGLSQTPRLYLVPVGADVLRPPSGNILTLRFWRVVDQRLPVPFPMGFSDLQNPAWIPANDSVLGSFADIRRFSSFRAYHDSGSLNPSEMATDSRLIGRSIWNTDWLLIIPGGTLLNNADQGLDTFINSVSDIKLFFQTYSYSGN